jgi:hypothetical protein
VSPRRVANQHVAEKGRSDNASTDNLVAEFVDDSADVSRRTTTLLVSLLTRAATLSAVTGAQAFLSMIAGLASLGRSSSETVDGHRLRERLAEGRVRENLELLFAKFGLGAMVAGSPPTPILEDFFNDLALLLAPDVGNVVDSALVGAAGGAGVGLLVAGQPVDPVDVVVGLWAFSREVAASIEALQGISDRPLSRLTEPVEVDPSGRRLLR